MSKAVKLLVSAFESSGKSTITSKLDNALVFNFDHKEYGFKIPHVNVKTFEGIDNLVTLMSDKLEAYNEKFGKYPSVVVFDTVTQLYSSMQKHNAEKYKGFEEHKQNNLSTLAFNAFIEDSLIPSDISVVITAHTKYDEATNRHIIPATGAFKDAGSWMSVVNDSVFIEKKANKLVVHTQDLRYPARSTLEGIPSGVPIEDYDLQDHLNQLLATKFEAEEFSL